MKSVYFWNDYAISSREKNGDNAFLFNFIYLFIYLLRFAKYTVYITLFNDKKT